MSSSSASSHPADSVSVGSLIPVATHAEITPKQMAAAKVDHPKLSITERLQAALVQGTTTREGEPVPADVNVCLCVCVVL